MAGLHNRPRDCLNNIGQEAPGAEVGFWPASGRSAALGVPKLVVAAQKPYLSAMTKPHLHANTLGALIFIVGDMEEADYPQNRDLRKRNAARLLELVNKDSNIGAVRSALQGGNLLKKGIGFPDGWRRSTRARR